MKWSVCLLGIALLCLFNRTAVAWDSIGHRVTAAVAYEYLSPETRLALIEILRGHPRFQQDFEAEIPAFIDRDDADQLHAWLLGQAAYWPDIARGLPDSEREKYNRPTWHYIDGAWVRGAALLQGNIYIGIDSFNDITGDPASQIRNEGDVTNVVTALDWNTRVLTSPIFDAAERAVALCWVLHLMGDIHQPLHTGSSFSPKLFRNGDRGGNAIPTDDGNLHARWDGAVRDNGVADNVEQILEQPNSFMRPSLSGVESDWTRWMNESRQLLKSAGYTDDIRSAVLEADRSSSALAPITLDAGYVEQMQRLARQRLGLAGLRLATWFENELN